MTTRVIHARDLPQHPDAIYIGREHSGRGRGPSFKRSRWANPWSVNEYGRDAAVALFARWITGDPEVAAMLPPGNWHRPTPDEIRRELRGHVVALVRKGLLTSVAGLCRSLRLADGVTVDEGDIEVPDA